MEREIKIGFNALKDMKIGDVIKLEKSINHTQEIGRRKK